MSDGELPDDFVDLVGCLRQEGAEFVIVGAHALAVHGIPRATGDLDVLIRPTQENAERVYRALLRFGAPVQAHGISPIDLAMAGTVYQMGLPPFRIDVLTEITAVSFDEAVAGSVTGRFGDESVRFIGIDAMIRNKRATGRTKDLADAEALEEIRDSRPRGR